MAEKLYFPVHKLNGEITKKISLINSAQVSGNVQRGLQNEIKWVEVLGKIDTPAKLDVLNRVQLSSAYCQFLWIICDIAIRTYDSNVLELEMNQLSKKQRDILYSFIRASKAEIPELKAMKEIVDYKSVFTDSFEEFELATKLISQQFNETEIHMFDKLDMSSEYGTKVNSIYCYVMLKK